MNSILIMMTGQVDDRNILEEDLLARDSVFYCHPHSHRVKFRKHHHWPSTSGESRCQVTGLEQVPLLGTSDVGGGAALSRSCLVLWVLSNFSGLCYQMQYTAHDPTVSDDNPGWIQISVKVPGGELQLPSVQGSDRPASIFSKAGLLSALSCGPY